MIRTDAELERVIAIAERGEQAEQELAYRAMVRDIAPSLYAEQPMLDDDRHVVASPKAKLESQRDGYVAALKAARTAGDRDLVAVLERALAEVRRRLAAKEYEDGDERLYAATLPPKATDFASPRPVRGVPLRGSRNDSSKPPRPQRRRCWPSHSPRTARPTPRESKPLRPLASAKVTSPRREQNSRRPRRRPRTCAVASSSPRARNGPSARTARAR